MADDAKKVEGASSRGADWEAVSLTASAYDAAPGPKEFVPADDSTRNEEDSEHAFFMSHHFVFPPCDHENLPIEPELGKILNASNRFGDDNKQELLTEFHDDSREVEFFDGGSSISIHDSALKECGWFRSNMELAEADICDMSYESSESPRKHAELDEKDKFDGSNLPCEAWWKRHSASLYRHATETNTFWSVIVAAAVMGLVIMGQRSQRDKWQLHQLKLRFGISNDRLSAMLGSIGQFKNILIGSHQHRQLIQGVGAATNH